MSDVLLERAFDEPTTGGLLRFLAAGSQGCFDRHRVEWLESFLAADGRRLVCRFRAPDAESARNALRQAGSDIRRLWPGTVHAAPDADPTAGNVLVERRFEGPVAFEDIQALEDANAWCLDAHRVSFVRSFFARDRRRMLCLYQAPDAEAVRLAQRQASLPFDRAWAFERVAP